MNTFFNLVLYIGIISFVLLGWFVVAVPLAIWFSFRVSAVWLIPAAFLIDGYFAAFYTVPVLTVVSIIWFLLSELIRPRLSWQSEF